MTYEIPKAKSHEDPELFTSEQLKKYLDLEIQWIDNVIKHGAYANFAGDPDNKWEIDKRMYEGQWLALTRLKATIAIPISKGMCPVNHISEEKYKEHMEYLDKRIQKLKDSPFSVEKKMKKFRFHRGSLEDSMETLIQVEFLDDIEKAGSIDEFKIKNLQCKLYFDYPDTRINWDKTYIIIGDHYVDGIQGVERAPVGFSDAMLNYKEEK